MPKRVVKIIERFPFREREHLFEIIREFSLNPWMGDIAKIKGEANKWRRRIGNYRIFYGIYSENKIVEVQEIERRTSTTY